MDRIPFIVNPRSSRADPDFVRAEASRWIAESRVDLHLLERGERVCDVAARKLDAGAGMLVAVGGDGTVSGVACALAGSDVPLAIVPMGTANLLAEQLGVPRSPGKAVELAMREHGLRSIDAIEIDGRLYLLNAGAGISAETVREMEDKDKRRFGVASYIGIGVARSFGFRPTMFRVTVDGVDHRFRGVEASVVNAGFLREPGFPSVPDIKPDDGTVDVLLVRTPTPAGYLRNLLRAVAFVRRVEPNVQWLRARDSIHIETSRTLALQADGDIIGETPARIRVVRGAVKVVVPGSTRTTLEEEDHGRGR